MLLLIYLKDELTDRILALPHEKLRLIAEVGNDTTSLGVLHLIFDVKP